MMSDRLSRGALGRKQWGRSIFWGAFSGRSAEAHRADLALIRDTLAAEEHAPIRGRFDDLDKAADRAVDVALASGIHVDVTAAGEAVEAYRLAVFKAWTKHELEESNRIRAAAQAARAAKGAA